MTVFSDRIYTLDDLAALPANGMRHELLHGRMLQHEHASIGSGICAGRLIGRIGAFVFKHSLGEVIIADTGFVLAANPTVLLAPDGAFVRAERMQAIEDEESFAFVVPDLVVEMVSPSETSNEVNDKVLEYLKAGVEMVLVVHPRRKTITVYGPDRHGQILGVDDTLEGGTVLPDFQLAIADIFA